ncbi:MAG: hypothetical protein PW789_17635 [Edaphobacter sp.]|uniref:hypothetical protein n=1 Tax=Edaphobacter sp. TaxID=1934404 RepID=UPI00239DDB42|nr:hypothetical protein [Edaphobacter sp.]MDE1178399.1 hypothetical protein [Edaphobacter sp.]
MCSLTCCLLLAGSTTFSGSQGVPISIVPAQDGGHFYAMNAYFSVLSKQMDGYRRDAINKDRQKHLEDDADRLMVLVTDLNREMSSKTELTPLDLSRRAAEIERLAHSVQQRMRG